MSFLLTATELTALWISVKVAVIGTLCGLPLAIGLALLMTRHSFPGKIAIHHMIYIPMILPPIAIGYILLILLAQDGLWGQWLYLYWDISLAFTWRAAAIVACVMGFPFMFRAIQLSLAAIPAQADHSARLLGAGRLRRLCFITLPLALEGIISGAVMGFGRALGEFGATMIVAGNIPAATRTLPLALYDALERPDGEWASLRLTLITLALALIILIISEWVLQRKRH